MAIYCIHCGTQLLDSARFCLNCGNSPRGDISTQATTKGTSSSKAAPTRSPKVEYKLVDIDMSGYKKDFMYYAGGNMIYDEKPEMINYLLEKAEPIILEKLESYFDDGWQLNGTYKSAIEGTWGSRGFTGADRKLLRVRVRLIRYS